MITSKQRAFLRGLANKTEATVQIGKGGINENVVKLVNDALERHELVKVHVLDNAFSETRDVCHELSSLTESEEVQVIGSKFVLYKQSSENKRIYLDSLIVKDKTEDKPKNKVKPLYKAKPSKQKSQKNKGSFVNFSGDKKIGGTKRRTDGFRSRNSFSSGRPSKGKSG